ncbi:hypothetical protein AV530_018206 [Patagioenas fasciata monilis]|uniref:Uncharacterized protein n=1 Tax=Patagioenas fasciata monilis TaxID=372326 RepID=A0A1V4KL76_PATFA|nr:hypothetical protein AV530_018206 [Patagioenas fasciata monilis]
MEENGRYQPPPRPRKTYEFHRLVDVPVSQEKLNFGTDRCLEGSSTRESTAVLLPPSPQISTAKRSQI